MIVVEGPDGAGKTTLINALVKATGLPIAPRVVSKETKAMTDLVQWVETNVDQGFQRTIFDRHRLISEPIYGPIIRPKLATGFDDPQWMLEMLSKFYDCNPLVIYCLPPLAVCYNNVKNDPDNSAVSRWEFYRPIWGGYFSKMMTEQALMTGAVHYDYTTQTGYPFSKQAVIDLVRTRIR